MTTLRSRRMPHQVLLALLLCLTHASRVPAAPATAAATEPVTFNKNFEGASIGAIEATGPDTFRCNVEGQCDERGHNRQASWFYFRMDHVRGRDLTVTLTDFVGEYNDKPGACPMGPDIMPVFAEAGGPWKHFPPTAAHWDPETKQLTLKFRPESDSVRIAHVQPYTPADLQRLLADVRLCPHALVEVIGKTAGGRDLQMITVTDPSVPDQGKKSVWLQARQHAWEAGTSYVMEGALRFVTSDEREARALRRKVVFQFIPMVDVDGCANGKVRFNANGYDLNRHWDAMDLRTPAKLSLMPEIWYTKKALVAAHRAHPIDVMVNLHNTETADYLETFGKDEKTLATFRRLFNLLKERTFFDSSRPDVGAGSDPPSTTNSLNPEYGIPVALMELRIATSKKLGRRPTAEDWMRYGRDLIAAMAEAVEQ